MNEVILFEEKQVRRVRFHDEWWFVISDVVSVLTESKDPSQYLKKLRSRDTALNDVFKGGVQFVPPLGIEFDTKGGRQMMQCWNTVGILRLIQSIPSPKAEPFKRWLAKMGYERLEEIENPELATKRMREIYKQKGYSNEWIEKRMRGIAVRDELTEEWKKRGVKEQIEYAILTSEISKATFGMTPSEYKVFKSLDKPTDNVRDHMTDLEIIFAMLGESSTTEIAKKKDARGFPENKKAAIEGGTVAGNARKELEGRSGTAVSIKTNYKELPEIKMRNKKISDTEPTSESNDKK